MKFRAPIAMQRRIIQLIAFAAFVYLFLKAGFPLKSGFPPAGAFLRFDALTGIAVSAAARRLFPPLLAGAVFLVLGLAAGRFFCGWLCPLGSAFDFLSRPRRREEPKHPLRDPRWRQAKYLILIFVLAAAAFSFNAAGFFDPLVILSRFFSLLFQQAGIFLGEKLPWFGREAAARTGFFPGTILLTAGLFLLLGLNFFQQRFFCRNLCPLGALAGWLGRISLFRRSVNEKCTGCGKCWKLCPTGAIREGDPPVTAFSECILCLDCGRICPVKAIAFPCRLPGAAPVPTEPGRRGFIFAAAGGIAAAALYRPGILPGRRKREFLRPPGSLPEEVFLDQCLRCGLCVKACPTGVIQPKIAGGGLPELWTPEMVMRKGYCDQNCNVCGQVCPPGAIRALPPEEKMHAKIGTAMIDRPECVAWSRGRICVVCIEVCPYQAIEVVSRGDYGVPVVNPERCAGCGMCEYRCPVGGVSADESRTGAAAIRVFPEGARRKERGSYAAGSQITLSRREVSPAGTGDLPSGFELNPGMKDQE